MLNDAKRMKIVRRVHPRVLSVTVNVNVNVVVCSRASAHEQACACVHESVRACMCAVRLSEHVVGVHPSSFLRAARLFEPAVWLCNGHAARSLCDDGADRQIDRQGNSRKQRGRQSDAPFNRAAECFQNSP
jgi:hypothetical protein